MHHAYLDKYANGDSFFHRLDGRVKFMAAVIYTAGVLSLPKDAPAVVVCYAVAPFAILVWSGIPLWFVCRRILAVCPFVLILALSCPLYDKTPYVLSIGAKEFSLTVGWLRCIAILVKFVVTMLTLFALVCTTRFAELLAGLEKMKVPRILVIQLSMLYRYLFVLVDRVHHILRARNTRKLRNLGFRRETEVAAAMAGSLFIRSIETSQKIHIAMQARGFCGQFHSIRTMKITRRDGFFIAAVIIFLGLIQWGVKPFMGGSFL
jgi:cobalt/nickel transport system permease protein